VELFERLRREYEFGIGTVKGVARTFGVHRRMVRQAVESALPPLRGYRPRAKPALGPVVAFIDAILAADATAPRKQRHTARRIHRRILAELPGWPVAESTVRNHVRERRHALGMTARPTFVPQSYAWGSEAQVDWYEATAELGGDRVTLQVFCMRSMASGAAFHRAYPRATQQAFLEAHEHAFAYFGGVHRVLRYDNLSSAVRKILRGHRREETVRFVAFRSHWRFEAQFCTPAAGHEKGGVEGEVGYFRRNHWVPVPSVADLDALNGVLLACCRDDERRLIDGRERCVGEALAIERDHLLAVAEAGFDLAEVSFPLVNPSGCITVHANAYSVPLRPGSKVQASLYAAHLEVWHNGARVARHERCHGRRQQVLDLDHYLDVLERKPGAMAGSKPLEQWRGSGRWPADYDALWWRLNERHGRQDGTRVMIGVIMLGRQFGHDRLRAAVALAVAHGACDLGAVRYLLTDGELRRSSPAVIEVGSLARYDRPLPTMAGYDRLLTGREVGP
jgi:transposase